MRHIMMLFLGLLILGCNSKASNKDNQNNNQDSIAQPELTTVTKFNYADFKIMKGRLGNIKIGMTITQAEHQFSGLSKKENDAGVFGFDGGGSAYLYYSGDDIVFALIPKHGTDTIFCIIAAHKELKTTNELNPKSSVEELTKKYPELTVVQDLMNGWEIIEDKINKWSFTFMSDKGIEIGEYPEVGKPSKPKRLDVKTDWIEIR
ncbi:MAG: hypothetical protein KA713_09680 [Chryseotalea sp. WA131a]|jgi:hypothetical protein|nr:MAG: hypothetical protein KA713_09680 [Chryseotalea sp. WA131a]